MAAFFFHYVQPPSPELNAYAMQLYARRGEGIMVPREALAIGGWEPQPNQCHVNVEQLAALDPRYTPVRGWLYFDLAGAVPYVRFAAHSVARRDGQDLVDITPAPFANALYPFIPEQNSEEVFGAVVGELVHAYGASNCLDCWVGNGGTGNL